MKTVTKRSPYLVLLTLVLVISLGVGLMAEPKSQNRAEIEDRYKWNLSDIYPNWETWEADLAVLSAKMDEFAGLQGTISQGPEQLLHALKLYDELDMVAYKVYRYPQLSYALDTRENDVAARMQQVLTMFARFGTATSWFNPEQLAIGWDKLDGWIKGNKELQVYRYGLENLYRLQGHVLDEDGEKLLSYYSQFGGTPDDIYTKLSTADIKFPTVELADGDSVKLTRAQYGLLLTTNRNQADRKKAFEAAYGVFADNINTYAAIYNSICQRDWAGAQAHNYKSTLEAALNGDNVPVEVYENLVDIASNGTDPIKRYYRLRQKVLGLEEYHLYDGAIPVVDWDKLYDYDEATEWIIESVAPLGKDYQTQVRHAIDNRWLDVYETEGKTSGAYSAGVYGVHPYMLLNYNGTLGSVFTTAHELGHTMHSMLSQANQPFATAHYTIFVAEVASTLNEAFFLDYMLEKASDPKERIAILAHAIEDIDGTFFTQVMFSDFEMRAHRMVEQGQPITADVLSDLMKTILKEYYGDSMLLDDLYGIMWARISHFFDTPYYVYKYATCYASSAQLYREITSGDPKLRQDAIQRHMTLLKSGGNDYPMAQLKKAGIDLTRPEIMQAVVDHVDNLVTQLEAEMEKI